MLAPMTTTNLADRAVDLGEWAKSTPNATTEFAAAVRAWLDENLAGDFADLKGRGGPGSEHEFFPQRLAWERHMAAAGWTCHPSSRRAAQAAATCVAMSGRCSASSARKAPARNAKMPSWDQPDLRANSYPQASRSIWSWLTWDRLSKLTNRCARSRSTCSAANSSSEW